MLIRTLKYDGVKLAAERSIELSPLTYFYGPNGVGKTTVLDALRILATRSTDGVSRRPEGILDISPRGAGYVDATFDDGVRCARTWKTDDDGKFTAKAITTVGARGSKAVADAEIERRFGANICYDLVGWLDKSDADKRRSILDAIRPEAIPGLTDTDIEAAFAAIDVRASAAAGAARPLGLLTLRRGPGAPLERLIETAAFAHEMAKSSARNAKDAAAELQGLDNLTETVTGGTLAAQKQRVEDLHKDVTTLREQRARFQGAAKAVQTAKDLRVQIEWERPEAEELEKKLHAFEGWPGLRRAYQVREEMRRLVAQAREVTDLASKADTQASVEKNAARELLDGVQKGTCPHCHQTIGKSVIDDAEEAYALATAAWRVVNRQRNDAARAEEDVRQADRDAAIEVTRLEREVEIAKQRVGKFELLKDQLAKLEGVEATVKDVTDEEIKAAEDAHGAAKAKLEDLGRQRAASELAQRTRTKVEIARVNEAYWKAVHAEVGISGYLGKVVAQASDVFLAAVRQYTTRPVGLSLTDANGKAVFAFGLVRETGIARVEVISGAEQAEVLAALGLALASMQGNAWRAVLVDNADRLDGLNLPRFMEAMTAAVENGWLDQAIVCGVNAPPVVKGWKITGLAAQG